MNDLAVVDGDTGEMHSGALDKLQTADRMLVEIASVQDALDVINFAAAAKLFARQTKLGLRAINHATRVRVRAEMRLADMVDAGQKAGLIAKAGQGKSTDSVSLPRLKEIGIDIPARLQEARLLRDYYTDAVIDETTDRHNTKGRLLARDKLLKEAVEAARQASRERLGAELAERPIPALDSIGTYNLLYVDPPWQLDGNNVSSRAFENHYPTMPIDDICALDVPAADDCVLFLWAISPLLPEALRVIDAWGFEYRTSMVWVKEGIGTGWWVRQQHELLLIGLRGDIRTPPGADRPASVVHEPRDEHSAKPDVFYDVIERMFPDLPRCELFGRADDRRAGWAVWGYEMPDEGVA